MSESFEDTTTFHSPRIHSSSHLVSPLTLSPYPVVTDGVSTSNVRFGHASEFLQRGEIRLDLVDKQSTTTYRKSYSPSNSRFDNLLGCIQNRMGRILGDSSNRRLWNTHNSQDHINILELKAAFFALQSFMIRATRCFVSKSTTRLQ